MSYDPIVSDLDTSGTEWKPKDFSYSLVSTSFPIAQDCVYVPYIGSGAEMVFPVPLHVRERAMSRHLKTRSRIFL